MDARTHARADQMDFQFSGMTPSSMTNEINRYIQEIDDDTDATLLPRELDSILNNEDIRIMHNLDSSSNAIRLNQLLNDYLTDGVAFEAKQKEWTSEHFEVFYKPYVRSDPPFIEYNETVFDRNREDPASDIRIVLRVKYGNNQDENELRCLRIAPITLIVHEVLWNVRIEQFQTSLPPMGKIAIPKIHAFGFLHDVKPNLNLLNKDWRLGRGDGDGGENENNDTSIPILYGFIESTYFPDTLHRRHGMKQALRGKEFFSYLYWNWFFGSQIGIQPINIGPHHIAFDVPKTPLSLSSMGKEEEEESWRIVDNNENVKLSDKYHKFVFEKSSSSSSSSPSSTNICYLHGMSTFIFDEPRDVDLWYPRREEMGISLTYFMWTPDKWPSEDKNRVLYTSPVYKTPSGENSTVGDYFSVSWYQLLKASCKKVTTTTTTVSNTYDILYKINVSKRKDYESKNYIEIDLFRMSNNIPTLPHSTHEAASCYELFRFSDFGMKMSTSSIEWDLNLLNDSSIITPSHHHMRYICQNAFYHLSECLHSILSNIQVTNYHEHSMIYGEMIGPTNELDAYIRQSDFTMDVNEQDTIKIRKGRVCFVSEKNFSDMMHDMFAYAYPTEHEDQIDKKIYNIRAQRVNPAQMLEKMQSTKLAQSYESSPGKTIATIYDEYISKLKSIIIDYNVNNNDTLNQIMIDELDNTLSKKNSLMNLIIPYFKSYLFQEYRRVLNIKPIDVVLRMIMSEYGDSIIKTFMNLDEKYITQFRKPEIDKGIELARNSDVFMNALQFIIDMTMNNNNNTITKTLKSLRKEYDHVWEQLRINAYSVSYKKKNVDKFTITRIIRLFTVHGEYYAEQRTRLIQKYQEMNYMIPYIHFIEYICRYQLVRSKPWTIGIEDVRIIIDFDDPDTLNEFHYRHQNDIMKQFMRLYSEGITFEFYMNLANRYIAIKEIDIATFQKYHQKYNQTLFEYTLGDSGIIEKDKFKALHQFLRDTMLRTRLPENTSYLSTSTMMEYLINWKYLIQIKSNMSDELGTDLSTRQMTSENRKILCNWIFTNSGTVFKYYTSIMLSHRIHPKKHSDTITSTWKQFKINKVNDAYAILPDELLEKQGNVIQYHHDFESAFHLIFVAMAQNSWKACERQLYELHANQNSDFSKTIDISSPDSLEMRFLTREISYQLSHLFYSPLQNQTTIIGKDRSETYVRENSSVTQFVNPITLRLCSEFIEFKSVIRLCFDQLFRKTLLDNTKNQYATDTRQNDIFSRWLMDKNSDINDEFNRMYSRFWNAILLQDSAQLPTDTINPGASFNVVGEMFLMYITRHTLKTLDQLKLDYLLPLSDISVTVTNNYKVIYKSKSTQHLFDHRLLTYDKQINLTKPLLLHELVSTLKDHMVSSIAIADLKTKYDKIGKLRIHQMFLTYKYHQEHTSILSVWNGIGESIRDLKDKMNRIPRDLDQQIARIQTKLYNSDPQRFSNGNIQLKEIMDILRFNPMFTTDVQSLEMLNIQYQSRQNYQNQLIQVQAQFDELGSFLFDFDEDYD